jgi:hypothetical protein
VILPANATARRREENLRVKAGLEAMDAKLDALIAGQGKGVASATSTSISDDDVQYVRQILGRDGSKHLPSGSLVSVMLGVTGRDYQVLAERVQVWPLKALTIKEAMEAGLLNTSGRLVRYVYERMVAALPDYGKRWVRLHEEVDIPDGRPARW